jgi:hypothetical protein
MNKPIPRYSQIPEDYYQQTESSEELPKLRSTPIPRYGKVPESYYQLSGGQSLPAIKEASKKKSSERLLEDIDAEITPREPMEPADGFWMDKAKRVKGGIKAITEVFEGDIDIIKRETSEIGSEMLENLRDYQMKGAEVARRTGIISAIPVGGEDERYDIIEYELSQGEITLDEYNQEKAILDAEKKEEEDILHKINNKLRAIDMGTITGISWGFVNPKREEEIKLAEKGIPVEEKYNELNELDELFKTARTEQEFEKLVSKYGDDYAELLEEFERERELFSIELNNYYDLPEVKHPIFSAVGNGVGTIMSLGMAGRALQPSASFIRGKILQKAALGTATQATLMGSGRFLQNYIPQAIGYSGPLFALHGGVAEFSEQLREDDLDPAKIFGGVGKGYLFGTTTALPTAMFSQKALQAAFFQGINFGGWATLDTYAQNGEINKEDIPNILISAGMGFAFELVSGRQIRDAYRQNEVGFFSQTLAANHIKDRYPNLNNKQVGDIVKTQSRLSTELFYSNQTLKNLLSEYKGASANRKAELQGLIETVRKSINNFQTKINQTNVKYNFKEGVDYIVKDGKTIIIDQHTGRQMHGRHWQDFIQGRHFEIVNGKMVPIEWTGLSRYSVTQPTGMRTAGTTYAQNVTQTTSLAERIASTMTKNIKVNLQKIDKNLIKRATEPQQVMPTTPVTQVGEIETPVVETPKGIESEIAQAKAEGKTFDEWVKIQGTPVYRGQTKKGEVNFNETGFQGNTEGGVFFTPDSKIAGKYGDNIIENISTKNNTVSVKESNELQKMATRQVENDLKNMVESDELIEQMALGRPKAFAEYTQKPFLETGDKFGESGELIYYKELDKTPQTKSQLKQQWDAVGDVSRTELTQKEKEALETESAAQYADNQKDVINLIEKYDNATERNRAKISQELDSARAKHERFWNEIRSKVPEETKKEEPGLTLVEKIERRDDAIQRLYDGTIKVRPDNQKNKEYIEAAVGDRAEDIISTNPKDMTFSEFAKSIDIEPGNLLKELLNRDDEIFMNYKIDSAEINKIANKEARKSIYKKHPYIREVEKVGDGKWGWNDLKKEDVAAIRYWNELGNKGVPTKIKEYYDNKYPSQRDLSIPRISFESKDITTLEARFETQLNLRIDNNAAIRKLIEINKYLHKNSEVRLTEKTRADGYYQAKREAPRISIKDINDVFTMAHETFHNFDSTIGTDEGTSRRKKLSTRIGAPSNTEEVLLNELKELSFYALPYDRVNISDKHKKYRNSPSELFAQWGAVWINDREKALELAPTFTIGMESKYGEHLNKISEIYSNVDAKDISPYVKPTKEKMEEMKAMWDVVTDADKSIKEKANDIFNIKNLEIHYWTNYGTPTIRGLKDKLFRKVFRAFVDNSVYEANTILDTLSGHVDFKKLTKIPEFTKEAVAKALYRGNERANKTYFTEETLRSPNFGFGDAEVSLYKQYQKLFEEITKTEIERVKMMYGFYELDKELQEEVEPAIEKQIKRNKGWVPLKRQETEWMVTAKKNKGDEAAPFASFNKLSEAKKYEETLKEMGYSEVVSFRPTKAPEGFMSKYGADLSIEEFDALASSAGAESTNPEIKKIREELEKLRANADAWARRPIIKRRWVPGYHRNHENLLETAINQIKETSSRYGRSVGLAEARRELEKIDKKKNPESYYIGLSYLNNLTHTSEMKWETARKIVYMYYLGMKTSHLVQNLLQRWIISGPWASKYVGFAKSYKIGAEADLIEKKFWSNKFAKTNFKIDKEIEEALLRGIKEKAVSDVMAKEVFGAKHRSRSKAETVIGAVSIVSDTSNRAHAMTMGILIARQTGIKGREERYKFAREFIEVTQILYGNHNAPGIIADSGKVKNLIRFLYIFKTFAWHDLQLGIHILKNEPGATKMSFLLNRALIAGLKGLIPFTIIDRLINYFTGKSPMRWARGKATNASSKFGQMIFDGVPSMFGMNASQLMGWGGLYNPDFKTEDQLLGAGWGIKNNIGDSIKSWQHGKSDEALEQIVPSSAKNFLVAKRWEEEGIFEVGKYVKIEPSKWEITQKKLGFTPQRLTMAYDFTGIVREYEKERGKIRGHVMESIKRGEKVSEKLWERIEEHNKNVQDDILLLDYTKELEISLKEQKRLFDSLEITTDKVNRWAKEARKEEKLKK